MAIGDTVQAGLMRVDTTPLLQAQIRSSEQMANAIAGLGRDIGSGIQKFMQNKKEGEAADMQIGALLQNMSPERQKEIQSGEGELGKSLSKFLSGELGNSKKKALLGSLMTINTADQLNREEAMAAERFKQQQEINNLNKQIAQGKIDDRLSDKATNQSLAKFMMQPVETPTPEFSALQREYRPEQIPGTPEFIAMQEEPIPARPSIIAKTITEQPDFQRFVKQDSPAVAQLPDSVKRLGRSIQDKVQSGELSNQAGIMAINNLVGPGLSPSDQLAREKFDYEKAKDAEEAKPKPPQAPIYMESALDAIDDAITLVGKDSIFNPTAGFGSETAKSIGGSDAADLEAALSTITSAVGFKRLQDMREASPTGGALGSVSERELSQLNAALGSISQKQSPEQLKKNLLKIKDHYQKAVDAINAQRIAYNSGLTFKTQEEALKYIQSQKSPNAIKTDQGDYSIEGLSVEAQ